MSIVVPSAEKWLRTDDYGEDQCKTWMVDIAGSFQEIIQDGWYHSLIDKGASQK
jgi:hypothetical protein